MRVAKEALRLAFESGLQKCPRCCAWLDWTASRRPNSPEPDHIVPYSQGGTDSIENVRVICRRCNQSLGGALGNGRKQAVRRKVRTVDLQIGDQW
ncbi:HNH endonuclease signature motif containing protein [Nesterenkonia massiliensis]|uniref:HNH endonuclease signature motif containing protein n=1 Tax=Nesterenkonia massiliensis TaxID=1232429 RepID=UPI003B8A5D66